jgi:hypothetical protein
MLVALSRQRDVHIMRWVQQNHDGLPQKAGFPQSMMNEIHGAWHDPTNPVVPMSGTLRTDLIEDLLHWEDESDLCLAMGSSLCGMNADRLVVSNAERHARGKGLGSVIISLQRTVHDETASLRIFAKLDRVAELLAQEMGFAIPSDDPSIEMFPRANVEPVFTNLPYHGKSGRRVPVGGKTMMTLDLRVGAKLRLLGQPEWDRVAVAKWDKDTTLRDELKGAVAVVIGRRDDGHFTLLVGGVQQRVLGSWWIKEAVEGKLERLPVVNL